MKSKAKHTPGPWEIREHSTPTPCEQRAPMFEVRSPSHSATIARCEYAPKDDEERSAAHADARLIAAAPELLAACKELLAVERHEDGCKAALSCVYDDRGGGTMRKRPCQYEAIRAAIAKAEGRS